MKVGMVGCGKLGLPVATAMALRGHDVLCFDVNPARMTYGPHPEREAGPDGTGDYNDILCGLDPSVHGGRAYLGFAQLPEVCANSEIVFVAVQTPHEPEYDGSVRVPEDRKDFDYTHLKTAISSLSKWIDRDTVVAIISTVLPGTIRREIEPLCSDKMHLVYNPSFIGTGTCMRDFLEPEFVLMGHRNLDAVQRLVEFYSALGCVHPNISTKKPQFWTSEDYVESCVPICPVSIETAEVIKVAYNALQSVKIGYVNTLMQMCHALPGADVDQVTEALALATKRLISPQYLTAGMTDGGACRPRDSIACSWLAERLGIYDSVFDWLLRGRESHTEWLAALIEARAGDLPVVVLGQTFKPDTELRTGSPAVLLRHILAEIGIDSVAYDPRLDGRIDGFTEPACFVVATRHPEFAEMRFPEGSVVLDPWRYVPPQEGVEVVRIGVGQ